MATKDYTVTGFEQVNTYDEKSKEFVPYKRGETMSLDLADANTKRLLDLGAIKLSSDTTDADVQAPDAAASSPDDGTTDGVSPTPGGALPPDTGASPVDPAKS